MKASEICIGDWFKAIDYNSPFRITAIYDDVVQTQADYQSEIDGNWYSEAEIKDLVPIELTEEILVKNGFKKVNEHYECIVYKQLAGDGFESQQIMVHSNNAVTIYTYIGRILIHIDYVHQLQHLVRLCGIEKELTI